MIDVAIVIVTWNVCELAVNALESLLQDLQNSPLTARIVVVDSASSDNTVATIRARFPGVEVIASPDNLGFGKANNVGMKHLGFGKAAPDDLPQAVYLLNPDTITQSGATETLFRALQANPTVGVVGANLTYGDGSFQHGAFAFPGLRQLWVEFFPTPGRLIEGRFNGRYPRKLYSGQKPFSVDFTLGATMMLRQAVILESGMFDEAFFMYCEEIDWAWRIKKLGWDIQSIPSAHVVHLGGQSTQLVKPRSIVNLWESRLRLFKKHYPAWKYWVARHMIDWGMALKIRRLTPTMPQFEEIRAAYQTIQEMTKTR